jgi:hypothetical protein|tara:strand:+ start:682 stop:1161 length:480 start_codon:yes stop_codon:yes gene_type:complete
MHKKQNNKESKTYVQGLRPFGNTLPRGVKGILKKKGYNYSEIINKWSFLVGKDISSFCYPKSIKITNGSKNGVLFLSVERGNEINIEYKKNDIINKINSFFGYKLITEIRLQNLNIVTTKKDEKNILGKFSKKYKKEINEIKSKNIRNSLYQLLNIAKK